MWRVAFEERERRGPAFAAVNEEEESDESSEGRDAHKALNLADTLRLE